MSSRIRNIAAALALTLACAATAQAFPPCPGGLAVIVPLDNFAAAIGAASWTVATYSDTGAFEPEIYQSTECPHFVDRPTDGNCTIDSFRLTQLPERRSTGILGATPQYSPSGKVGVIGLPDVRDNDAKSRRLKYSLSFGINATPLRSRGDWVDLTQFEFQPSTSTETAVVYRLRKISPAQGESVLQLIASDAQTQTRTSPQDVLLATIPLKYGGPLDEPSISAVSFQWVPHVRVVYAAPPGTPSDIPALPVATYIVDTDFELLVDGIARYNVHLTDRMPNIASMGVLDYNIATTGTPWNPPVHSGYGEVGTGGGFGFDGIIDDTSADAPGTSRQPPDAPGDAINFSGSMFKVVEY